MNLSNLKIGPRLALSFGLVLVLMLVLITVACFRFSAIKSATDRLINVEWTKAEQANLIELTMRANARHTLELTVVSDPAQLAQAFEQIDANKKAINAAVEVLEKLIYKPEAAALLTDFKEKRARYVASFTKVGQLVRQGERDAAARLVIEQTMPALDAAQQPVHELAAFQKKLALESGEQTGRSIDLARNFMIGVGLVALLIGAASAFRITRSITRPLGEAIGLARSVADGDLTRHIEVRSKDETGDLMQALKDMNHKLQLIVGDVRSGTDTIATASGQIASGNLDLSARTEEQASSLEETASSMEELTSTVKQNADNARQASQLAASASQVADQGGQAVSQLVETMASISASSKQIVDIISVIDGIAFQTNILALNAAVEAARAGEQGRGFAVVASEVRNLAQRSASAAKEIKALIDNSALEVDTGAKQAGAAGDTMREVVQSIQRVADIMQEITAASTEQSAGIEQINQAVIEMDSVTQQNAALVEEASAAAQALQDQAENLARTVSVFKLDANSAGQHTSRGLANSARSNGRSPRLSWRGAAPAA